MTHPRKKIDTEQSALKSSQAYTPLVDQLANYWLHQGANVSAAEQISGAQLSALKQSSEGGHPGWSGNFMEVLRGEFKPHGKVGKSQRLMGKDQKGFEVSRKLRGKQFLATTSGMPVADVVDDPENCLCVGEFSMNGRAWKQLFGFVST